MKQNEFDIEMMKLDIELNRKLETKKAAIDVLRQNIARKNDEICDSYRKIREMEQAVRDLEAVKRQYRMDTNLKRLELKQQLDEEGGLA